MGEYLVVGDCSSMKSAAGGDHRTRLTVKLCLATTDLNIDRSGFVLYIG